MMPSGAVPPELVDMTVGAHVDDMLCRVGPSHLELEAVSLRAKTRVRRRCSGHAGDVGVLPPARLPPQLVDVTVCAPVVHMLGALDVEDIASGIISR